MTRKASTVFETWRWLLEEDYSSKMRDVAVVAVALLEPPSLYAALQSGIGVFIALLLAAAEIYDSKLSLHFARMRANDMSVFTEKGNKQPMRTIALGAIIPYASLPPAIPRQLLAGQLRRNVDHE